MDKEIFWNTKKYEKSIKSKTETKSYNKGTLGMFTVGDALCNIPVLKVPPLKLVVRLRLIVSRARNIKYKNKKTTKLQGQRTGENWRTSKKSKNRQANSTVNQKTFVPSGNIWKHLKTASENIWKHLNRLATF